MPTVVVPDPFQVRVVPVCTAMPPAMVLPVAFVVSVLEPVLGVCNWPVNVNAALNVSELPASSEMLAADTVPLVFDPMVAFDVEMADVVAVNAAFIFKVEPDESVILPPLTVNGEPSVVVPALTRSAPDAASVVANVLVLNTVVPLVNVKIVPVVPVMFKAAPRLKVLPITVIVLVDTAAVVVNVLPLANAERPVIVSAELLTVNK